MAKNPHPANRAVAENRKARFNYEILEDVERSGRLKAKQPT